MADFSMTGHRNNYIDGVTRLGQLEKKIENMRSGLFYAEDIEKAQAALAAAEAECERLRVEVDDLKCLADTGRHRAELNQASGIRWKQQAGGMRAHFPENKGRQLNR